jgi:hypothetical protein
VTFADEIEEAAEGEPILYAVIGKDWDSDGYTDIPLDEPLPWDVARAFLARDFYTYPPVYAWSDNWVVFVNTYDGSTSVRSLPRNPVKCHPYKPGG